MHAHLERCTIRPWQPSDAAALARHANNRNVWRNLRDAFPHPYGPEDAARFLAMVAKQTPPTYFAIVVDGEAAGGIGYTPHTDVERISAELGYWLAEPFWNRGITTEAVRAVTHHALFTHGLERIYATPFGSNTASHRVLEKAGFTLEARLRHAIVKEGKIDDALLYARIKSP